MKAYIYTGGKINPARICEHPRGDDLVIAADSGWNNATALGERPTLLLGDMDSLGEENIPEGVELFRVPAEKDLTDTQLAVDLALSRGATEIVIIGGLSGRLDHTLSNLAILEHLHARGVRCLINDGYNRARYLKNDSILLPRGAYRYLSLLAADDKVRGVSAEGVKYPLQNATLSRRYQYAVSNELTGNCAFVAVRRGGLYLIESDDR